MPFRGHLVVSWDIFSCHDWRVGWGLILASSGYSPRCYWHPTRHRTAPKTKNYPAPNVNSAEVEKPWCQPMFSPLECGSQLLLYTHGIHLWLVYISVWLWAAWELHLWWFSLLWGPPCLARPFTHSLVQILGYWEVSCPLFLVGASWFSCEQQLLQHFVWSWWVPLSQYCGHMACSRLIRRFPVFKNQVGKFC